jgi:hypothetical protein
MSKNALGYFLGDFFTNSSGHPDLSPFLRLRNPSDDQGCQIFLGTKYQNGKNYTKLPRAMPNVYT